MQTLQQELSKNNRPTVSDFEHISAILPEVLTALFQQAGGLSVPESTEHLYRTMLRRAA